MKKVFGIPYVLNAYGSELVLYGHRTLYSFIMKQALAHCQQFMTISLYTAKQFLDYGLDEKKLFIKTVEWIDYR